MPTGNLSIRLSGSTLLTTPTGRRKDELDPEDLVVVPLDASAGPDPSGPKPSSDIAIHRAIYRARVDVVAIIHAHLPASMALTLAGSPPDPMALPETAYHLPVLPVIPYGAMGSGELAARIAAGFVPAEGPAPGAVLLERHRAIAAGSARSDRPATETLTTALLTALLSAGDRMELVDVLCRTWRDAILLRAALGRTDPLRPIGG